MTIAAELLPKTLKNPLKETPQDETNATFCRKLSRSDGSANPSLLDAQTMDRMVRAFVPWPGVTITHEGKMLKILETSLEATPLSTPLPCRDDTVLHLVSVQPEGKKAMSGRDWKNGLRS